MAISQSISSETSEIRGLKGSIIIKQQVTTTREVTQTPGGRSRGFTDWALHSQKEGKKKN